MPANIEIKAVLTDSVSAHAIATRLSGAPAEVVDQTDIFFPCAGGRFKLRVRGPNDGELIFYDRPDGPGPRHSDYLIARTGEPLDVARDTDTHRGHFGGGKKATLPIPHRPNPHPY